MIGYILLVLLLSYSISVLGQSYGNESYTELKIVKEFHLVPHYDSNYQMRSRDFNIDTGDLYNTYAESVIVLPITITILLFIAFCIFEMSLCCRVCCKCCTCIEGGGEPSRNSIGTIARWTEKISTSRDDLLYLFIAFLTFTMLCCSAVVWAVFYIMDGNDNGIDATHNLQSTTSSLEDSGDSLALYGNVVYNLSTAAIPTCDQASIVQEYTATYQEYVSEYNDIIGPIPGDLNTLEDFLKDWGEGTGESTVWNIWGLYLLLGIFMVVAYVCKSKTASRVALGCGLVVGHATLALFCCLMIALTVLADFCMAPTDNALSVTPDSAMDVATYYGTCNGTNPFASSLIDAYDAAAALNASLNALTGQGGVCENNPYLVACYPAVESIYDELDSIEGDIACGPIQQQWVNVFNKAVCHDYYIGVYILFYSMAFTIVLLLLLLIVWSLLFQYFGKLWETDEHIVEVMSTDSFGNALFPGSSASRGTPSEITDDDMVYNSSVSSSQSDAIVYPAAVSSIHYNAKDPEVGRARNTSVSESTISDDNSISLSKKKHDAY